MPNILENETKKDEFVEQNSLKGNTADTILNPKIINVSGSGLYSVGAGINSAGVAAGVNGSDIVYWAGQTFDSRSSAPFRVDLAGNLTANSVTSLALSEIVLVTNFEAVGRFTRAGNNPVIGVYGLQCQTGGGGGAGGVSSAFWEISQNDSGVIFAGSPKFTCSVNSVDIGSNGVGFVGMGNLTSWASTTNHIGFKIIVTGGNAINIYGTQADGTTESATASLITSTVGTDTYDLICIVNGTTSVDYYTRLNGGTLSTKTSLTTNIPTSGAGDRGMSFVSDEQANLNAFRIRVSGASYRR